MSQIRELYETFTDGKDNALKMYRESDKIRYKALALIGFVSIITYGLITMSILPLSAVSAAWGYIYNVPFLTGMGVVAFLTLSIAFFGEDSIPQRYFQLSQMASLLLVPLFSMVLGAAIIFENPILNIEYSNIFGVAIIVFIGVFFISKLIRLRSEEGVLSKISSLAILSSGFFLISTSMFGTFMLVIVSLHGEPTGTVNETLILLFRLGVFILSLIMIYMTTMFIGIILPFYEKSMNGLVQRTVEEKDSQKIN